MPCTNDKIQNILILDFHSHFQSGMHKSKFIFLFLNKNICCGYSKELWDSFECPKHILKLTFTL